MAIILTLAANARSSVPTEHPGKISSGPTTLFGVPGITGHTICRTLYPSINTIPCAHFFKLFTFLRGHFRSLDGMAVREISQIDITRDRNRSVSQLRIPATSTN